MDNLKCFKVVYNYKDLDGFFQEGSTGVMCASKEKAVDCAIKSMWEGKHVKLEKGSIVRVEETEAI